ncbi:cation transporter [Solimonas flava]|uniref:cation transporter n=1 Tax=Solimonas flava TaxID=415849 RepID=UPI0004029389|nr:cation diffusion facilitator family transporter [Solimonas flava]
MSTCCSDSACSRSATAISPRFRRVLWIALWANLAMFGVELAAGWGAHSVSLLADAVDFFGDAANYGLSLAVLSMAAVWRSRTALLKGASMGLYGLYVLGQAAWNAWTGSAPEPMTMGVVATLALAVNASVALMLYAFRDGDANMRSVWLCSRNDAIGNVAVMLAALGVFGTHSAWPDLLVAAIMAGLGLTAARSVLRQALHELRDVDGTLPRGAATPRTAAGGR